jgi:hypothetical protein
MCCDWEKMVGKHLAHSGRKSRLLYSSVTASGGADPCPQREMAENASSGAISYAVMDRQSHLNIADYTVEWVGELNSGWAIR